MVGSTEQDLHDRHCHEMKLVKLVDHAVYACFPLVRGNAGTTDGSTKRGKKDKCSACRSGIFHKYSSWQHIQSNTERKLSFLGCASPRPLSYALNNFGSQFHSVSPS